MNNQIEIFANEGLSTIFDGALVSQPDLKADKVDHFKVIGYRLETIKRENVRVIARMPEDENGVYRATVFIDGIRRKGRRKKSAFFPKHWTKEQVIKAVCEAYQNKVIRTIAENMYVGKTLDGMNIILWLDQNDRVIDAMPFRDEIMAVNHRKKLKRLCKTCQQPKHSICLEHHNFEKKGLSKVWKKIRYYSRKFYFTWLKK